jgi:hypothetical protein
MHKINDDRDRNEGLIALVAVNLIALGTLAMIASALTAAMWFVDSVSKKETRIQADLYSRACVDSASLMLAKNYFLKGDVSLKEFGCQAKVSNDYLGRVTIDAEASVGGVPARRWRSLSVTDSSISVIGDEAR